MPAPATQPSAPNNRAASPTLRGQWRGLAAAALAAAALHAVLLGGWPDFVWGETAAPVAVPTNATPLSVRQILLAPPARPSRITDPPAPSAVAVVPAQTRIRPPPPTAVTAAAAPPAAGSSAELAPLAPTEPAAAAPPAEAALAPASSDSGAGTPPPLYRTQPAPAATLLYDLKRGLAGGQAVLEWRPKPQDGSYTLTLQAQAFGLSVAAWNSSGHFDAAGLAPQRYAESRRGREVRATNFQRAADKISFSGQGNEFALTPGVQDRSSWMLQLGAILQAQPELALPGTQISLVVVGTRGAPEPWVFTVMDRAALVLTAGDTPTTVADAVHLRREPRRPYDTRANVWLDPARHHLPVKVQLLVHATGEGQEFELRQLTLP